MFSGPLRILTQTLILSSENLNTREIHSNFGTVVIPYNATRIKTCKLSMSVCQYRGSV